MARVKGAMMTRKHRNKILGLAKGYWGSTRLYPGKCRVGNGDPPK